MNTIGPGRERAVDPPQDARQEPRSGASRDRSLASPPGGDPAAELRRIELQLRNRYLFDAGKYHFRDGNRGLAFEDRGDALRTPVNDQGVIASMLDLAEHRGWKSLQVTGTTGFRRSAWLAASERGLQVQGFQPTAIDRVELEERRAELSRKAQAAGPRSERATTAGPTPDPEMKLTPRQTQYLEALRGELREQGASDRAVAKVLDASVQLLTKNRTYVGKVIEHGQAPFEHNPNESLSYFIRLDTDRGERVVWGKDIARALEESKARIGDAIGLQYKGARTVVVDEQVRNTDGRVIETRQKETNRNEWEVTKLERLTTPQRQAFIEQALETQREPKVRVWDRQAPARTERAQPTVQPPSRQPERTRG
jgi:hypothetical protein